MLCNIKDVAFCSLSEGGDVYIQKFGDVCKNFRVKITKDRYTRQALHEKKHDNDQISTAEQQTFAMQGRNPSRPKSSVSLRPQGSLPRTPEAKQSHRNTQPPAFGGHK